MRKKLKRGKVCGDERLNICLFESVLPNVFGSDHFRKNVSGKINTCFLLLRIGFLGLFRDFACNIKSLKPYLTQSRGVF